MACQSQLSSKWFLAFLLLALISNRHGVATEGAGASNIESIEAEPAVTAGNVAATPNNAAAAPVATAPVAAATPAVVQPASASTPAVASTEPVQGISGTTTEHKNADGSIITVTKFNGQLPPNAFQQHFPQMFSSIGSFGNPFYGFGSPLYPSFGQLSGVGQTFRSARSVDDEDKTSVDKKPWQKRRERYSDKVHYPSPAPEYFSMHGKPFVPVIDNEFSDLI